MAEMKNKRTTSPLEVIRKSYTNLTQDEFIFVCGFKRSTYQQQVGFNGEEPRFTPGQLIKVATVSGLSFKQIFEILEYDVSQVPGDYEYEANISNKKKSHDNSATRVLA